MCKQHNSSSAAQLSQLSKADRRQHFNNPFTHLHHAVFHFHPTIQVAMFLTYQGYPFTVTAKSDHCWKIHPQVSACAQHARATALQKYHCEYFRITKSNPKQTFIFHLRVLIPQDIFASDLFLRWDRHQYLNFLRDHANRPILSPSGNMVLTNKPFSCPELW